MWELDYKEIWMLKNWCFWTVVLEKTLESPLDSKVIKPVNPKGNQSWIFIGRTDDEPPIFRPPNAKSWLIRKDPDAGKDWRWEEKGMKEEEMAGWHHWLYGPEFEWAQELEIDQEAWCAAVHRVKNSLIWLSDWTELTLLFLVYWGRKELMFSSIQFSSVTQSCLTLCDPMNRSTPGLPVHHQLPEFTQTHVQRVSDAIQPAHPLLSPSPPAPNPSQHQSLFQWVNSSHEVAKVLEFQL